MISKAQIVATIGPSCADVSVLSEMIAHQMDVARLNLFWGSFDEHAKYIEAVREAEKKSGRKIVLMLDLPGPRLQTGGTHTYDPNTLSVLTDEDKECIKFGVDRDVDYFAESFVGDEKDILHCREVIKGCGGSQRIVAKIERSKAIENLAEIIKVADAIMVARGDMGSEVPLERIPFVQDLIVRTSKAAAKPVIVATEMLFSMVESPRPTRADVTDVAHAILQGADAVMLSEETAKGKYPIEVVTMMEKIVVEAERHMNGKETINPL